MDVDNAQKTLIRTLSAFAYMVSAKRITDITRPSASLRMAAESSGGVRSGSRKNKRRQTVPNKMNATPDMRAFRKRPALATYNSNHNPSKATSMDRIRVPRHPGQRLANIIANNYSKYHKRVMFTINQLSYTLRSRRRPNRLRDSEEKVECRFLRFGIKGRFSRQRRASEWEGVATLSQESQG
jgi:hypothetical protein